MIPYVLTSMSLFDSKYTDTGVQPSLQGDRTSYAFRHEVQKAEISKVIITNNLKSNQKWFERQAFYSIKIILNG